jgi:hypothetical protein
MPNEEMGQIQQICNHLVKHLQAISSKINKIQVLY